MDSRSPARPRPSLSLVVNTRNEERHLPGLLATCAGVDQFVVADMESTDRTLEIARARGAAILSLPNAGCCEPGRQAALDAATGDWILVLDADERLPEGAVPAIRRLIAEAPPDVDGFSFAFHVFIGPTRIHASGWETRYERHPRLFRRGRVSWPPEVHAVPSVPGRVVDVAEAEVRVVHHNFADLHGFFEKMNRYSSIEARELTAAGGLPSALAGLGEGLTELARRYDPEQDGALSLALGFGLLAYKLLEQAKAAEALGWPAEPVATRRALLGAVEAFWRELIRDLVPARPRGAGPVSPAAVPVAAPESPPPR
jgi:hypothetical protein